MQDLEKSFGYQLRLLHLEADRRARQALDAFGMTPARVTALLVIAAHTGCTQTALGEALSINRASAMKMVNALETLGMVSREPAADPRAHALTLTAAGGKALDAMLDALRKAEAGGRKQQYLGRMLYRRALHAKARHWVEHGGGGGVPSPVVVARPRVFLFASDAALRPAASTSAAASVKSNPSAGNALDGSRPTGSIAAQVKPLRAKRRGRVPNKRAPDPKPGTSTTPGPSPSREWWILRP